MAIQLREFRISQYRLMAAKSNDYNNKWD